MRNKRIIPGVYVTSSVIKGNGNDSDLKLFSSSIKSIKNAKYLKEKVDNYICEEKYDEKITLEDGSLLLVE